MHRSAKKTLQRKYRICLLISVQKTKLTQTSGSVFSDKIENVKKANFKIVLIEFVDCFLDGHGNYTINLVYFEIRIFYSNSFLNPKKFVKVNWYPKEITSNLTPNQQQ